MQRSAIAVSVAALAAVAVVAAAGASAAARLVPGALYTSQAGSCRSPGAGLTCVFRFRASANGQSLRFVGTTVVDTWICNGGGGEALLGGKKGEPIPPVNVVAGGRLHGSVKFRSPNGKTMAITVTGRLANAGKTAAVSFHSTAPGGPSCSTRPVSLTAH